MQKKEGESIEGFRILESKRINEIDGVGEVFYHEQTGVTVICLKNQDPHKVFCINFLTLPENNKGTAHIVEHAVCCASKKYPLKETFVAVGQGSICTTMNACTYPDRTMYYVASPHEKDLLGIAEVYMDLVFQPCIEEESKYFLQEGWHYILSEIETPLEVSGVVYHEMIAEYGEASSHLLHYEMESLFPDTIYQYDSGGIPEEIIQLSEKEFLEFYRKHYIGSNAVITVYGDIQIEAVLSMLNRTALKSVRKGEPLQPIVKQPAFEAPRYQVAYYPTALKKAPSLLSMSFVVGDCMDCELRLAFEILEHMLIRSTASPLLKALIIEQNLGVSLSDGGYDSCRKQPVFTITLKGGEKEQAILFETTILKVLTQLVEQGIDPKLIDAAIKTLEFELRETDASYEPIGILYSEMILSSYLYGGAPFSHLCYESSLEHIRHLKHKGYFEGMIKKYLLENPHRLLTVLLPSESLYEQKEKDKEEQLEDYKTHLKQDELEALVKLNDWLEEEQLKENEEDLLKKLPHLKLEDMPTVLPTLNLKTIQLAGCELMYHEEETKDIAYIHFLWDARVITKDEIKDLGLLAHIFTYIGTETKSYSEIENEINTYTGGMNCAVHAYHLEGQERCQPIFKLSCKILCHQIQAFVPLMNDLLGHTTFKEKEKLRELLGHIVYELERSFTGAPEYRASQRLYTYLSAQGVYEDTVSGIGFYEYVKEIYERFDAQYEVIIQRLETVMKKIIQRNNMKLCMTAPKAQKDKIMHALEQVINELSINENLPIFEIDSVRYSGNEGFYNGQDGQAVAQGIRFTDYGYQYHGQFEVISNVLENTYLWDRVRLQGGAYGCDIMISREGYLVICSYCDPHLETTLEVYSGIGEYLRKISLDEAAIERAVITTLGAMIAPISMEQKSERACMYFITGMTQEKRQVIYDEIKQTCLKDFKEMSELFDQIETHGYICILGNKEKLMTQKNRLSLIDLNI